MDVDIEQIKNVIGDHFMTVDGIKNKYMLVMEDNKVFTANGRMLFDSPKQAMKSFYNSLSWRIKSTIRQSLFGDNYSWRGEHRSVIKSNYCMVMKELKTKYNLRVIKL